MRCTAITGYFISGFHLRISEYFISPLVSLTNSFKCSPHAKGEDGDARETQSGCFRAASEMLGARL